MRVVDGVEIFGDIDVLSRDAVIGAVPSDHLGQMSVLFPE